MSDPGVCVSDPGMSDLGGGCLTWGAVLPGGCLLPGGSSSDMPPVNRMTDRCKNITLATTSLRPVIKLNIDTFKQNHPEHQTEH